MIESKHKLSYCPLCDCDMVVCFYCGNNCCNGGTGDVMGERCGCDEAYAHQTARDKDRDSVRFVEDVREKVRANPNVKRFEAARKEAERTGEPIDTEALFGLPDK